MKLLLTILLLLNSAFLFAQTKVNGRVTDAESQEPIGFATVVFKGTAIGTTTDFNGYYELVTNELVDTLIVQFVGYKSRAKAIIHNTGQTINFQLEPDNVMLNEIAVLPGKNPAHRILNELWDHKKQNDMRSLNSYQYESYTKLRVDVDNISEKFKNKKIMKPFGYLFDSLRVIAEDGAALLPIFVSETLSDLYAKANPNEVKEVVKATNIKGVGMEDGSFISQFVGSSLHNYNFYQDNLVVLDKSFVSPIGQGAIGFYIHVLEDSLFVGNKWCYQIKIVPKRKQDLVFSGTIWIQDTTFSLVKVALEVGKDANLNFVERLKIHQELEPTNAGPWLPSQTRILVDIAEPTAESFGMLAKLYISNRNVKANVEFEDGFFKNKIQVDDFAQQREDSFWVNQRHEKLSSEDEQIFNLVDSIKNFPKVKSYIEIANILASGYVKLNKNIEFGSFLVMYGVNVVEKHRFRIGFRSTPEFNKNLGFRTYLAYGLNDERFKYGVVADYIFNRKNWLKAGVQLKHDLEGIGAPDDFELQNPLLEAASQLGLLDRLNRVDVYRTWIGLDVVKNFNQKIIFTHKYLQPEGNFVYAYNDIKSGLVKSNFTQSEIALETKWAPKETKLILDNKRVGINVNKAPVFTLRYTMGLQNVLKSNFSYHRLDLDIRQIARLNSWGRAEYIIQANKIFTPLPYLMLHIFPGNETFIRSLSTFNMMDFFEFVSDQSLSVFYVHHFDGVLMNRIPLMRKLKWRAVGSAKMAYGTISKKSLDLMPSVDAQDRQVTPVNYMDKNQPYVEIGYGFENIFKFIRIQAFHRLTYTDDRKSNFGIKGSVYFNL